MLATQRREELLLIGLLESSFIHPAEENAAYVTQHHGK